LDIHEIPAKLIEWAAEIGLTAKRIEDPTADFHIVASEPNLPTIEIVHPRIESTYLLIVSRLIVSEEDQRKMLNMKFQKLENLLWDIRLRLLSINVEFRILRPAGGVPTTWHILTRLSVEDATAQRFADVYLKVKSASLGIAWSLRKAFGTLESGTEEP
jgi:hypothetical protein